MYNMDDTHTTQTTNIQSTLFADQAPILPAQTHITGDNISNDINMAISDNQWTVMDLLNKPTYLSSITWSATSTPGIHTKVTDCPPKMTETAIAPSHKNYLLNQMFLYHKLDLVFRFVINGTKYHYGRYAFWFNPLEDLYTDNLLPDRVTSIYRISGMPYVLLDPSTSSSAELVIPYTHFRHVLARKTDPAKFLTYGSLYATPWTSLRSAVSSSANIQIAVYWYCRNAQLNIPIPEIYPAAQGLESLIASGANAAGAFATGNVGSMVASGMDLASQVGGLFSRNRDKPSTSGSELSRLTATTMTPPSYVSGPDSSTRLAAFPFSETTVSPALTNSAAPETGLKMIRQREMLLDFTTITDTSVNIFTFPVDPLYKHLRSDSDLNYRKYDSTFLSYFTDPFTFWRGSLVYRFEFVKSPFHVGRFIIFHLPEVTPTAASSYTIDAIPSLTSLPHV
jgi:hypothetical protein